MKRVGIFGWGVVAPKSPNIETFARNLGSSVSWLSAFRGFGPSSFLVGDPELDFSAYRPWIDQRFLPNRYPQLVEKMDPTALFAVAAFIQALGQNPGLEQELQAAGTAAHVYVGTGLGALPTIGRTAVALDRAQRRWNRFWAEPVRNAALRGFLEDGRIENEPAAEIPAHPDTVADDLEARDEVEDRWYEFWAGRSDGLAEFLEELRTIESLSVDGEVEAAKLSVIKTKKRQRARLQAKWGAPEPPWTQVPPELLWNIANIPAAQISMLGRITGASFAPVAACSTFGVALALGMDAIREGRARAVVVGACDPAPHPLTVGGFFGARVLAADGAVSKPLTGLRGTHVAGGSVVWIIGDYEYFVSRGMRPLGMEPLAVGLSSDADHIITPSTEGPTAAVDLALAAAGVGGADVTSWDLHATATPGDFLEVENMRRLLPGPVLVSARKGTFGHGMSAAGGWELTAQYLGYEAGVIFPTPLEAAELNPEISRVHDHFVFDNSCAAPAHGVAGKLSMGIGGINACVISRPWPARGATDETGEATDE